MVVNYGLWGMVDYFALHLRDDWFYFDFIVNYRLGDLVYDLRQLIVYVRLDCHLRVNVLILHSYHWITQVNCDWVLILNDLLVPFFIQDLEPFHYVDF